MYWALASEPPLWHFGGHPPDTPLAIGAVTYRPNYVSFSVWCALGDASGFDEEGWIEDLDVRCLVGGAECPAVEEDLATQIPKEPAMAKIAHSQSDLGGATLRFLVAHCGRESIDICVAIRGNNLRLRLFSLSDAPPSSSGLAQLSPSDG